MSSGRQKRDTPTGATGRARSAASGLHKPLAVMAKKKTMKPVTGKFGIGAKTVLAGHGGVRKPGPTVEKKPETQEPYPLPSFFGDARSSRRLVRACEGRSARPGRRATSVTGL
jgi:hypothetical protein